MGDINWSKDLGMGGSGALMGAPGGWMGAGLGAVAGFGSGLLQDLMSSDDNGMSAEQKAAFEQQQAEQQKLFSEGQDMLGSLQNPSGMYGDSLNMLQSAAQGNQPSQAQILMNQGIQNTEGMAMGMAASNNGVSPALAMRNAMLSAGNTALQGVSQNAALRATEMATARSQYSQAMMQNQQMQANLITGQAGTAAQMAGQAGGNATQMAMPGITTNAQTGQMMLGNSVNMAGNAISNWAKNGGGGGGGSGSGYYGTGMSQDDFFKKWGAGNNSAPAGTGAATPDPLEYP